MNLSAEYIEGLATETGFRTDILEKVIRLGEFAADIGRHPLLSPELLFPDDEELANRLIRYPALLWKIENVKRHRYAQ